MNISIAISVLGSIMLAASLLIAWANSGGFVARLTSSKTIEGQQRLIETNDRQIQMLREQVVELTALVGKMTAQNAQLHADIQDLKAMLADRELDLHRERIARQQAEAEIAARALLATAATAAAGVVATAAAAQP